jgi:adenosyl cobinamide kinase/adenosyl cobinamide phosphate guanylyltransferase
VSPLTLLLGGARSGKSALAVRLASASGQPVTFVATAQAGDAEMAERISRHRRERPAGWATVEESIDLRGALDAAPADAFVVVDCLSLWVANLLEEGWDEARVEAESAAAASRAAACPERVVAVSNEVGMGVVPVSELGRRYRDLLGRVNGVWAENADEVVLVVAGRALRLEPSDV